MKTLTRAEPSVFYPNMDEHRGALLKACTDHRFLSSYPTDNNLTLPEPFHQPSNGILIAEHNYKLIDKADAVLADLSPYSGVSADIGTAMECAYAFAQGKPIFGYTQTNPNAQPYTLSIFADRVRYAEKLPHNATTQRNGHTIEDFGLYDNLMLVKACTSLKTCLSDALNDAKQFFSGV